MIVVCPNCASRFQYDESRFQGAPHKRFKCPKCGHIFEVANPALAPFPAPAQGEPTMRFPAGEPLPPTVGGGVAADLPSLELPKGFTSFPEPSPAAPISNARTTARRDREAMLTAAGLQGPGMPVNMRFSLAGISGPMASTVQVLEKPLNLIGREEGDVVTKDPETSRRHASVEIHQDGTVWLMDLDSTNGTFVGGQRIGGKVQLEHQGEFSCGNSTFMLMIRNLDDALL